MVVDSVEAQSREGGKGDAKMPGTVAIPVQTETLSGVVVDAALAVHRALGPGMLESTYRDCLAIELSARGHQIEREKSLPLVYRDTEIPHAYRIDLLVDTKLLVELKAVTQIEPIHRVQLATYLKLLQLPLGLLINFNVPLIKNGISRVLNLDLRS